MAVVADSGAVYALYDADDRHHAAVVAAIERQAGAIILPAAILSEIDYLLREFLGADAELGFLDDLANGAYSVEPFTAADVKRCRELLTTYRELSPGLADTAVIATAERLGLRRILTVDERDFRAMRGKGGAVFDLLPADLRDCGNP